MAKPKKSKGLRIGSGLSDLASRIPLKTIDPEKSRLAKEAAKTRKTARANSRHPWRKPFKRGQVDRHPEASP